MNLGEVQLSIKNAEGGLGWLAVISLLEAGRWPKEMGIYNEDDGVKRTTGSDKQNVSDPESYKKQISFPQAEDAGEQRVPPYPYFF